MDYQQSHVMLPDNETPPLPVGARLQNGTCGNGIAFTGHWPAKRKAKAPFNTRQPKLSEFLETQALLFCKALQPVQMRHRGHHVHERAECL
jgi:hypothetical protein